MPKTALKISIRYETTEIIKFITLILSYAILARIVLTLSTHDGNVTVLWLPGGLALAALLTWGIRFWPAIFIGALLAGLIVDDPWSVSSLIALGNTLETLLAVRLLQQSTSFNPALRYIRDYFCLTRVAILSSLISTAIGPTTLWGYGFISHEDLIPNIVHWWQADTLGILMGTPFILIWREWPKHWSQKPLLIELTALIGLTLSVGHIIFLDGLSDLIGAYAKDYWSFLPLIWAAWRFGRHGVLLIIMILSVQAIYGFNLGIGLFSDDSNHANLHNFWFYILVLTFSGLSLAINIDQLKRTQVQLRQNTANLKAFFNHSPVGIQVFDKQGKLLSVNQAALTLFDISDPKTLEGYCLFNDPTLSNETRHALRSGQSAHEERHLPCQSAPYSTTHNTTVPPDQQTWLSLTFTPCYAENSTTPHGYITSIVDLTEKKHQENQIMRLNRSYAVLAQTNRLIRRINSEQQLFDAVCRIAVQDGDFRLAWIGRPQNDSDFVLPIAQYGVHTDYLKNIRISIDADKPEGQGPTGSCWRQQHTVVIQDFPLNPKTNLWHQKAKNTGNWKSSACFLIRRKQQPYALFSLYHNETNAFDNLSIDLLNTMMDDVGFALEILDADKEREHYVKALTESESRFERVSHLTSDLFYSCQKDQDGNYQLLWLGGNSQKLFGCSNEAIRQKGGWFDFIHPEDTFLFEEKTSNLPIGQDIQFVIRLQRTDGQIRHVNCFIQIGQTPDQYERLFGALQDISERKVFEQKLLESETRFRAIFNQAAVGLAQINTLTGQFIWANPRYAEIAGVTLNQLLNITFMDITHPDDLQADENNMYLLKQGAIRSFSMEKRCIKPDQSIVWIELTVTPMWAINEPPNAHIAVIQDITERKEAEEKLKLTQRIFETTLEGIIITDANRNIIDINQAFTNITGYSRQEVLGKNPNMLKSGYQDSSFYQVMWETIHDEGHWSGELWNRRKNGETYPEWLTIFKIENPTQEVTHYVGISADITLLKKHEQQLEHIAHYDALTGIPNRVLLADRMRQSCAQTQREGNQLAICYLDLDGFKPINDTYGHQAGDQVLIQIANRIRHHLRGGDTVSRLGGDEFVILLLDFKNHHSCIQSLNRLLVEIEKPIWFESIKYQVTASIGVTLFPKDNADPDMLLRHADQAMYQAKQEGKNRFHIFDPLQDAQIQTDIQHRNRIEHGLSKNEFMLFYQPKVTLDERRLVGAEALIRWQHPERGLLSPLEFLPLIENTEVEIAMGEWVIDHALQTMATWNNEGLELEVSINIAATHLQSSDFVAHLKHKLSQYRNVNPRQLQIEIVETVALSDITQVSRIMDRCKAMQVEFALDDFGTGYSSLAYLRRLPAKVLKIDQSFICDMLKNSGDKAIVQGIIALASTFSRMTVAEGVETEAHFNALRDLGCDLAQGYHISRPMPADAFLAWASKMPNQR